MARNEKRRQKNLMKKRSRDKAKKAQSRQAKQNLVAGKKNMVFNSASLPLHSCQITTGYEVSGIANIAITRTQRNGDLLMAYYLVDLFCLGLKDTFTRSDLSLEEYEEHLRRQSARAKFSPCSLTLACQIIYGAIDFAEAAGFSPHKDFQFTQHCLPLRETVPENKELVFGHEGKPLFISGPYDSPYKIKRIINQLIDRFGVGGFDFLAPIGKRSQPDFLPKDVVLPELVPPEDDEWDPDIDELDDDFDDDYDEDYDEDYDDEELEEPDE